MKLPECRTPRGEALLSQKDRDATVVAALRNMTFSARLSGGAGLE